MTLTFTILGCGSSGGVPRPGLGWGACNPANPKNRRRRGSCYMPALPKVASEVEQDFLGLGIRDALRDGAQTQGVGHDDHRHDEGGVAGIAEH